MRIGVPTEIKKLEHRVGMTPDSVLELTRLGHEVRVQSNAGLGIDFTDEQYEAAGATIVPSAEAAYDAELIIKVKEPQLAECEMLSQGQTLFTYLHLAADKPQAEALERSGAMCIAYETVTGDTGGLPLLRPMSEVAGRMSVQVGAWCLEKAQGGRGTLLGGVPGGAAPKLVTKEMLGIMKPGAVLVDIAIDQGGCFETSHATTHDDPIYEIDGIVHYCVANMPGAVPRTSTFALNNRTLPHIVNLAELGTKEALRQDKHLRAGLNVAEGWITHEAVARDLGMKFKPAEDLI